MRRDSSRGVIAINAQLPRLAPSLFLKFAMAIKSPDRRVGKTAYIQLIVLQRKGH